VENRTILRMYRNSLQNEEVSLDKLSLGYSEFKWQ